jgi:hypothetical protein
VQVGAPEVFDGQGFASIANSLSIYLRFKLRQS